MFTKYYLEFFMLVKGLCILILCYLGLDILRSRDLAHMIKPQPIIRQYKSVHKAINVFNIRYIEQTTLRKYMPWITVQRSFMVLGAIFSVCLLLIYIKSKSIWLGLALASVMVFCPLVILDTLRQYNYQKTRGELIHFLSLLSQWYMVTEDIIKSFEKISEQSLTEPMATYVNDFVIQIHSGLEITDALELLGQKIESDFFNTIVVNIDQAIQNRGDVGIMLSNLEDECYRLQEEFNRRKISTVHDKMVIYCTMILVLLVGYHFLVLNSVTETFYFHTPLGQALVLAFSVLYVIGFFITLGLSRLEY